MKMIRGATLFSLCAVVLSACFDSKQPLINEAESVTPIRPGAYVSSTSSDEFKVAVTGTITSLSRTDGNQKTDVDTYLMRPLRAGYFVVMDRKTLWYGLIAVDHQQITSYDDNSNCDHLEELAFEKDVPLSKFGVSGLKEDHCSFARFDKLAAAFSAILDSGKVEVETTYRPKGQAAAENKPDGRAPHATNALIRVQSELRARGVTADDVLTFIRANKDKAAAQAQTITAAPTDAAR
ncbi:MAG: hypothetical protein WAW96_19395 [Alphaproteobacteria bacterium]